MSTDLANTCSVGLATLVELSALVGGSASVFGSSGRPPAWEIRASICALSTVISGLYSPGSPDWTVGSVGLGGCGSCSFGAPVPEDTLFTASSCGRDNSL